MIIERLQKINDIAKAFEYAPAVAILGPRQCGKTTLAKQFVGCKYQGDVHFFDLEDPLDINRLENPMFSLEPLKGLIVIDEIQRVPELFSVLRVLIDRDSEKKFLILGSASRDLLQQSSETLAGRISYLELSGFSVSETGVSSWKKLWKRGGFPRSFLANSEEASFSWRQDFISTFLERDIPNLGVHILPKNLRRFWSMTAHYHGRILNSSELARSMGVSSVTIQKYMDLLSGTFVVRQVQPWFYNTKKRIVKSPKIYFRDTGLLHALLNIENYDALLRYPEIGASWEGFALEEVIKALNLKEENVYFWSVHSGAECDLVYEKGSRLRGVEFKFSDSPKVTKSMRSAIAELDLEELVVVYPGEKTYQLDEKIKVVPIRFITHVLSQR